MNKDEVRDKMTEDTLEGKIYRCSVEMLENNREEIIQHFPDPALRRRNSGYAIDQLLYSDYFDVAYEEKFNLCKLLAGSEGTLDRVEIESCPVTTQRKGGNLCTLQDIRGGV